jgi:peptide/nickel transport system substrate-binding protein
VGQGIVITRRGFIGGAAGVVGGTILGGPALRQRAAAQEASPVPVQGGQVNLAFTTPATLNPFFTTAGVAQGVETQIYGALLIMTADNQPHPDLAETIEVSEDGLTFTFTLQDGLTFTDGSPLTSDDALFTYERCIDPRTGSFWRSRLLGIEGAADYDGTNTISGLQAPDEKTFIMKLTAPDATWQITLGDFAGLCILSRKAFGDIAPDQLQDAGFSLNPTPSAGRFTFTEYLPDQYLSMTRNDSYPGTKANLDTLYLKILPQSVTALSALQNGEIDAMEVQIPDLETVQQSENLNIYTNPSLGCHFLTPNTSRPAFADKRVRQAMYYAIDREGIAKEIMKGQVQVVGSTFFGWEWEGGQPEGLNPYPYDPEKAKSLLAEAGYDASVAQKLLYLPENELTITLVNIFQQQLIEAGFNIELFSTDVTDYVNRVVTGATADATGDFDISYGGGGVFGQDPNVSGKYIITSAWTPTGSNYTHWSNPRIDELMELGKATIDIEERKKIYTEAAMIFNDEAPWIVLWNYNAIYGVNKRIQGFVAPGHGGRMYSSAHQWWVTA